ncbi:AraC-like DNA-binding protein/quercetin dioxygenase-like cupin family protein [Alkalihalobacillus xiaoxiensis]|uniref:AraC-like DNA-binding protein/quercetin dioxygenase-like cupin family protein n=1 Tax=Shouchella xiaoxiensis TaxID=766895 RepID=A0ABS2SNR1_9BACI|nr:helix-turn-helix domain-containing protein [Shouchella xiaoxiensis]MBM7836870.1 AraC-like DNA-binding protein/quercetin dioxygenase-like cupin family protein [Shouchella xiaoxiensis]
MSLLEKMLALTEEEQETLQYRQVMQARYTSKQSFIIEANKFLAPGSEIMVRKHTRFIDFPKHRHDYIELNYVYNGSLKQKIGEQDIHLKKGELVVLNQHIEHQIDACDTEDIVINFIIQPSFFNFIFSFLNVEGPLYSFLIDSVHGGNGFGQFLYFKCAEEESIQMLLQKMVEEIMNPDAFSQATTKLHVGMLIIELTKKADTLEGNYEGTLQNQWLREALSYIHEQYKQATLTELSARLNQPHYLLSKLIKKRTGKTFKAILQEKRLDIAREMLVQSDLPVSVIAEEVGYDNFSYFYQIFKKKFEQTPLAYRKRQAPQE